MIGLFQSVVNSIALKSRNRDCFQNNYGNNSENATCIDEILHKIKQKIRNNLLNFGLSD
jgi:hypothetical protein